jgi:3-deoxy-7-phosphoheptulonate synthase
VEVAADITQQLSDGCQSIMGVMIESHLKEGRQDVQAGCQLTYGQSITDACLGWDSTLPVLNALAEGVRQRRTVWMEQNSK